MFVVCVIHNIFKPQVFKFNCAFSANIYIPFRLKSKQEINFSFKKEQYNAGTEEISTKLKLLVKLHS